MWPATPTPTPHPTLPHSVLHVSAYSTHNLYSLKFCRRGVMCELKWLRARGRVAPFFFVSTNSLLYGCHFSNNLKASRNTTAGSRAALHCTAVRHILKVEQYFDTEETKRRGMSALTELQLTQVKVLSN
jgi:hypothetical protein